MIEELRKLVKRFFYTRDSSLSDLSEKIELIDQAKASSKMQVVPLGKGLNKLGIGLSLLGAEGNPMAYDWDLSAFMIDSNGKCPNSEYFIFYNNRFSPDGSLELIDESSIINCTYSPPWDDAEMSIDLTKVNEKIQRIIFILTIHQSSEKMMAFGQLQNSYLRIKNIDNDMEFLRFHFGGEYLNETSIELAMIIRQKVGWGLCFRGDSGVCNLESFVNKHCDVPLNK